MPSPKRRLLGSLLAAGLLLAACGGVASPASPAKAVAPAAASTAAQGKSSAQTSARPLTPLTFYFSFYIAGYDAPFLLARSRGYYAQEGLDVSFQTGRGSSTTALAVGAGSQQLAFADAGTTAEAISKGAAITVVACIMPKTPIGLIYMPQDPIKSLADLKGRTFMADAGSAGFQLLPAILGKAGLTVADIHEDAVSPQAQPATFKAHPDFIVIGNNNSTYISMLQVAPQAKYISFANYGVNPYGLSIIANRPYLRSHSALVRKFVAASLRGWQAAQADPQAAVEATLKAYPTEKEAVLMKGLQVTFDLLHVPDTSGHPLGWMSPTGWRQTIDLLHRYGNLKNVLPLSSYYTDQYIPQS